MISKFIDLGSLMKNATLVGGMILVDHASNKIFVNCQPGFTGTEAIWSKKLLEREALDHGVILESYLGDNDTAFSSVEFQQELASRNQRMRLSASYAHHQNGKAERAIGKVMSLASTMMMHAWLRWPEQQDATLWPLAVRHSVYLWNVLPDASSGLSPNDIFTGTIAPLERLSNLHVWGCPTYVLEPMIANGKKLPKWSPKSRQGMFVGYDESYASSVGLQLNLETRSITPQFHVVYDDWFTTTYSNGPEPPPEWAMLFHHSRENVYEGIDDDDDIVLPVLSPEWLDDVERQKRLDTTRPISDRPSLPETPITLLAL